MESEHQHSWAWVIDTKNLTTSGRPFLACRLCGQIFNIPSISYDEYIESVKSFNKIK